MEAEQPVPTGLSTGVDRSIIERIADAHVDLPAGFTPHPRVKPVLEKRAKMAREGGIDWAFAELLALGSVAWTAVWCGCPDRTPGAARSCNGTRC